MKKHQGCKLVQYYVILVKKLVTIIFKRNFICNISTYILKVNEGGISDGNENGIINCNKEGTADGNEDDINEG